MTATFTDDQMALDLGTGYVAPAYEPEQTIQQRYELWRDLNPWVLTVVEHYVAARVARGHRRVSMKRVWEAIRDDYGQVKGDPFAVNNSYSSRAARDVLARRPEWAGVIVTRELRAA